jgi:hypothetical protein
MARYDDARFRVIHRKYFGLPKHMGGDAASPATDSGFTIGSATAQTHFRWYPRGPIRVLKAGSFTLATLATPATNADVEYVPVRMYKSSAGGTANSVLLFSWTLIAADTSRSVQYAISSDISAASEEVEAGRFITLVTGSPTTAAGTVDNGTVSGTLAFFLDWAPKFSPTAWDD